MNLSNIAECIRKIRIQQNMTIEQLAGKSGFTKGYISKLENFRVTPSISALSKISSVLGVPVTAFFENDLKSPLYLKGNLTTGEEIDRDEGHKYGIRYFSQAFKKIDRVIDPFIIEYTHSDKLREMNMHDADEFYLLLEGEINFYIGDMSNCVSLKPNDTLYLSANLPHTAQLAEGCKFARAMVVYGTTKKS